MAGKTTLIKCLLDFAILTVVIRISACRTAKTHARKPLAYLPESFFRRIHLPAAIS